MRDGSLTTVAIPLHHGAEWIEVVAGNLERLAGVAQIIVSDPFEEDDAFQRLRARFAGVTSIEWHGRRPLASGWVPHYNDLLARGTTPYFMWLAQDDEIGAEWIREGEQVLNSSSDVVLACGTLDAVPGPGLLEVPLLDLRAAFVSADRRTRLHAAGQCLLVDPGAIGTAFRGVFRTDRAGELPATPNDGAWSDVYWVCSMLSAGRFGRLPSATYRKRWRHGSTHRMWGDYYEIAAFGEAVARFSNLDHSGDPLASLGAMMSGVFESAQPWRLHAAYLEQERTAAQERARVDAERLELLAQRTETLERAGERLESDVTCLRAELKGLYASRSWRLTAPLRRVRGRR